MEITTERISVVGNNWESKHPQKKIAKHNILLLPNAEALKMTRMWTVTDPKRIYI